MTVYFYGRCSDEEHFNKGTSIDTQIDKCKSYCSLKDMSIDVEIKENCSGTVSLSKRQKGFELLHNLKRGDSIVCLDISRFSRNSLDLLQLVEKFKRQKITLHFTDIGEITGTDAVGSVVYKMLVTFQEFYANTCSERQKNTQQRLIRENRFTGGFRPPFGFDKDEDNVLFPVEKEQVIIRLMQLLRRKGLSYQKIAESVTRSTKKKFVASWVFNILKREEKRIVDQLANSASHIAY